MLSTYPRNWYMRLVFRKVRGGSGSDARGDVAVLLTLPDTLIVLAVNFGIFTRCE